MCSGYPPDSATSLMSVLESTTSEQSVLSPGLHHSILDERRSSQFGDRVDSNQVSCESLPNANQIMKLSAL